MRTALALFLLSLLPGCSSSRKGISAGDPRFQEIARDDSAKKAGKSYIIGVGDVLRTTVYEKWPYSGENAAIESPVRDDKTVVVPGLGKLMVENLTILEVEDLVTKKLSENIKQPFVVVELLKSESKKVYIFGEVVKPGIVPLTGESNLLDIIAAAGGVTDKAHLGTVSLVRPRKAEAKVYDLDLKRVVGEGRLVENVLVQHGDIVYVPRSPYQGFDRVMSAIGRTVPLYFLVNTIYETVTP